MRRGAVLAVAALITLSCGQASSSGVSPSPSPIASGSAAATSSAQPSSPPTSSASGTLSGSYGMLLAAGMLDLVKPNGTIVASVAVAEPSVQYCSSAQDGANLERPVSASNDEVYFRDGDTKVRMLVPPAGASDVTTVPGGPTTVSFFSVSPDDRRIAVLVEDLSAATTISLRLYVEDLRGGGHHADIFSTIQPKGKQGTTIWPMGWHQGALVLAVVTACTFEPAGLTPSAWHVSNATTAARIATINASNCMLSYWPSAAGVGCIGAQGSTTLYDWTGKATDVTGSSAQAQDSQTGLSPAGNSIFFSVGVGLGAPPPETSILQLAPGPYATVAGHSACSWIDEDHLLAPDAVIQFPAETPGNVQVTATVTPLPVSGVCAGRFPGGL